MILLELKYMNILSLFDGISCGQLALKRSGIKVNNYFASEIDSHAIKVTMNNFPETIQMGGVTEIKYTSAGEDTGIMNDKIYYPTKIDLLIGGSPCQGFSFAGKQLNFDDPRSKLFFEYVRILKEIRVFNPDVLFLLENVKMKKKYKDIISKELGVEPIEINSALVSAQNRRRLYWTNIEGVTQPEDKGILLKDILQKNVDEVYFLKDKRLENWIKNSPARIKKCFSSLDAQKAICMTARQYANWYGNHVTDNGRVRQLTEIECERLQTLPDNYTQGISNTQRYKAIGNGWTVDVISHIFSFIQK